MFKIALVPLSFLCIAPLCSGEITYTSQQRYAQANGLNEYADNYNTFSTNITKYRQEVVFDGQGLVVLEWPLSKASQTSTLTPTSINVSGSILGGDWAGRWFGGSPSIYYAAYAESICTVTFDVNTPTSYTLDAMWSHGETGGGPGWLQYDEPARIAYIDFSGPGVHHRTEFVGGGWLDGKPPTTHTLNKEGILQPGQYTLDIHFEWNAQPFNLNETSTPMLFSVDMNFSVPTPSTSAGIFLGIAAASRRKRR